MLDVTRRFYTVEEVKRVVDWIALYRLNILRLHLSDDQGWRLAIDAYPELTDVGALTQTGWPVGSGGPWFYTQDDYGDIVAYAASRGVTIVPEFEGPGHTNAAQTAIPELNCDDQPVAPYIGIDVGFSLLCLDDPVHIAVSKDFLDTVWRETADLTPGPYLHIGGDEAHQATDDEYRQYVALASGAVRAQGKRLMGWQQIAGGELPDGAVIQFWSPQADPADPSVAAVLAAAEAGADVVMSPASRTYLDHKYDAATVMGMQWAGFISVEAAYTWDPATFIPGGQLEPERILGVEACLFADRTFMDDGLESTDADRYVPAATYAGQMLFPRLPATAEVAWSGSGSVDEWPSFASRLARHAGAWRALGIDYFHVDELGL